MQFGANLWIWESPVTTEVIRRRVPWLREAGFDLAELPLEQSDSWNPAAVRAILDDAGLGASVCVAMSPDRDLTTSDRAVVASTQDYLRRAIEAAATVGSPVVGGPIYSPTGRTMPIDDVERARLLDVLAANLAPILDDARNTGIRLAIEPLNRFETSLFNTVIQTLDLVRLIDDPALGLLLDTFHMNIEEADMVAAFRAAGADLAHVHACGNDRGAPGNGSMPWPEIATTLAKIGYDGAITIESFAAGNQAIARATSIWRPLAPTQDDIATDGLRFLRTIYG